MRPITVLSVSSLLLAAFAASGAPTGVRIEPEPVPEGQAYPHPMAVRISPPWEQEGQWRLRAPETLGSNRGLLFIDHHRPDMVPVTYPVAPLRWTRDTDGGLRFAAELSMHILLHTRLVPGADEVSVYAMLINGTPYPLENMGYQFCLVQQGVAGFEDPDAERTFVLFDGEFVPLGRTKPGPVAGASPMFIITNTVGLAPFAPWDPGRSWVTRQQADAPLIATVSADGRRTVALAFDNSYKIMTNCDIPCIHADPQLPDCPADGSVRTRGKVYFIEGTPADALARFYRDFPEWGRPNKDREP